MKKIKQKTNPAISWGLPGEIKFSVPTEYQKNKIIDALIFAELKFSVCNLKTKFVFSVTYSNVLILQSIIGLINAIKF